MKMILYKNVFHLLLLGVVLFLCACVGYDYEEREEYFIWSYEGLIDDTTAVVSVVDEIYGYKNDNHFMGWDDGSYTEVVSKYYYPVGMQSRWVGKKKKSLEELVAVGNVDSSALEKWMENCFAMGEIDGQFLCLDAVTFPEFRGNTGLILVDKDKKDLDTLELENWVNLDESVSFLQHYLKVDNNLYEIRDGKFISQRPKFRIVKDGRKIVFIDENGDFTWYGGEP